MNVMGRLLHERSGNFGMMTAILAMPMILAAGSVVDYSVASMERTEMQGVADAAALAGAGVYNGTNAAAAKTKANDYLDGYAHDLPAGATYAVSMSGQTVKVDINGSSPNAFMGVVGISTTPLSVTSSAIAPLKPKSVSFEPTRAQGYWWKKVSIMVVRPGTTKEVVVGTVVYQPHNQFNGGQGEMTVSPNGNLDLGKYSKLVLKMEVKTDGCPLYHRASVKNAIITCTAVKSNDKDYNNLSKYSHTLRTDNPDTSHYLFVEKKQMPRGSASPLDKLFECGATVDHAWEDGGGFDRQDFFYTAESKCAPDGEFVRLTQ